MNNQVGEAQECWYFPGELLEEPPDMEELYAEADFDGLTEAMSLFKENGIQEVEEDDERGGADVMSMENENGGATLVEADWLKFSRTFVRNSETIKLSFSTYQDESCMLEDDLLNELEEILRIYGSLQVMSQATGVNCAAGSIAEAKNVRRSLSIQSSLGGEAKSIKWRLEVSVDGSPGEFVGVVGLSLSESKHITPHVRLEPRQYNKGIAKQIALCFLEKLLANKDWLLENVTGLFMEIQPENKICLMLKDKLLTDHVKERRNVFDDGVWTAHYVWLSDKQTRTHRYRHFVCDDIRSLELIWATKMHQQFNKAELLLLQNERKIVEGFSDLDAKLQNFSYTFNCGDKRAKLVFTTFQPDKEKVELKEMESIFWDRKVMDQADGVEEEIFRPVQEIREEFLETNALEGPRNSIRWKVYYIADSGVISPERVFAGIVGMTIKEHNHLGVHSYFKHQCTNKKIGSKVMLCLLHVYLDNADCFQRYANTLLVTMAPNNRACLGLLDKLLIDKSVQVRNPAEAGGTWPYSHSYAESVTLRMNKYTCELRHLNSIWKVHMRQAVNTADLLLYDSLEFTTEPKRLMLLDRTEQSPCSKRKKKDPGQLCELDAKLQKFTYLFDCGDKRVKLMFETFDVDKEVSELEEIKCIFWDKEVMRQSDGRDVDIVRPVRKIRERFLKTNALAGEKKSIRWKLYYVKDSEAVAPEKEFIGFVGVTINDQRKLGVHSHFKLHRHNKKIGYKSMLCLLHVYLTHDSWFRQRVDTLQIWVQPKNRACISLMERILLKDCRKDRNTLALNGTWPFGHPYAKSVTLSVDKYLCSIGSLKAIWEVHMQQAVNTADLLLYDSLEFTTEPKRLKLLDLPEQSLRSKRRIEKDPEELCDVDAKLQKFTYTFDCGDKRAKLIFETFQVDKEDSELEEIQMIFCNREIMKQSDGVDLDINRPIRKMRAKYLKTNALEGVRNTIRWKLYHVKNTDAEAPGKVFVGYVGMGINAHRELSIHSFFRLECHGKKIGSKVMLCLLHIFLDNEAWFMQRVDTLCIHVHPKNRACLGLLDKLLIDKSVQVENPAEEDGTWPFVHSHATVLLRMNKYMCSITCLNEIWKVHMQHAVNTADLLLYDSLEHNLKPKRLKLLEDATPVFLEVLGDLLKVTAWDRAMEKSLQEFTFKIDKVELTFITFESVGSIKELNDVYHLFSEEGDGNCIETPIQSLAQANALRQQMRFETSFMDTKRAMTWKLFVSGKFFGCISLRKHETHLVPSIRLLSQHQSQGYGRKVVLCLLAKLMSNKEWFIRNFDGLTIWVHPNNTKALGLLEKIIKKPQNVPNPGQKWGFWILETETASGCIKKKLALKFELNSFARVESLFLSVLTVIQPNKEWKFCYETAKVTLVKLPPKLGLQHVSVKDSELDALVVSLSKCPKKEDATLTAGGTLNIHLPTLGRDTEVFYLLFFRAGNEVRAFDLVLSRRFTERRKFVALDAASVKECHAVRVRMVDEKLSGFQAFLVKVDVNMFDSMTCDWCSGLRNAWCSMKLPYKKRCYKTKLKSPLQELRLEEVELNR